MIARFVIVALASGALASFTPTPILAQSQGFQPRGGRPLEGQMRNSQQFAPTQAAQSTQNANGISRDLLQLHAQTESANTEALVTSIARGCSKIIPNANRSDADRQYAASLLAWALNRRGEMRNQRAADLVNAGKTVEAASLDKLAAEDFETAIEYAPRNWRTRHNLAIALAMQSKYPAAIEQLSEAIDLNPDYANARFNRGELYFELSQYTQALRDYSAAIELDARDPQYYNSRAHCRFMLAAHDDAIADYRRAAELATDSAVYQTDLADALQYLGQWEQAAEAYREAVAINNKYPRAYQNAAWLMATCPDPAMRNTELAKASAKKAIELGLGRTAQTLDTLAAAIAATGNHGEASKLLRQALQMTSDPEEKAEMASRLTLYERGQAYLQPEKQAHAQIRTASGAANSR
ncbi:MAG: tetratricopeptide repeat protein [Pirellulaceae bacterium]